MFENKKIWLVGASEGIGEAVARKLAAQGATLILSARNQDKLHALSTQLSGSGHIVAALDVTDTASVEAAWNQLLTTAGRPDIVMYNAGAYDPMGAAEFDLERTRRMMDVNFTGALHVLQHVIPAFVAARSGHIALVGSVAGYSGLPKAIGYGASKAALIHLAENMRVDLASKGIKVQIINPGFVKTRLTDKNEFPMPFLMNADQAADRIVKGLASNCFEVHFPRRLSLVMKFMRLLPYRLYFWLLDKAL
jgi:short-subunit dehydrogenase